MEPNTKPTKEDIVKKRRKDKVPLNPLDNIALSCSGGGYRAASFHLGAMSYLNRIVFKQKPLLERVKMISTVSGGTITGSVYALMKQQERSFKEIFDFLMTKLHTVDLVKEAINKLNPGVRPLNPTKRKNLINAFAELYDEHFTKGAMFAEFDSMNSHLEAVVFNSTEFSNGNNFRFRNHGAPVFGNGDNRIAHEAAREVKIADAIAASACFPGGFEPMIWPHDFIHANSPNLDGLLKKEKSGVGLMDGGVYDNQGIQSILLYDKDTLNEQYFDLIIISDVASPYMVPFIPTPDRGKKGLRSYSINTVRKKAIRYNRIMNITLVFLITLSGVGVPLLWNYSPFFSGFAACLMALFLTLTVMKRMLIVKLKSAIDRLKKKIEERIKRPDKGSDFKFYWQKLAGLKIEKLSVHRVEPLLLDRLNSLIKLLSDIFLKVVRRLNYNDLYSNDRFMFRRMANLVKELTETDFNNSGKRSRDETKYSKTYQTKSVLRGEYADVVGKNIKEVVEEASSFGTTLWFTEENQLHEMLNKLVATGQFTMCFNMVDYLEQLLFVEDNGFDKVDAATQKEIKRLYEGCLKDWESFKLDPKFMLNA